MPIVKQPRSRPKKAGSSIWLPSGEIYHFARKIRPHHTGDFQHLASALDLQDDVSFFFVTKIGNDLFLLPTCYPRTTEELHSDQAKLYFLYHLCEKYQSDSMLIPAPHKDSDFKLLGDYVISNRKKLTDRPAGTDPESQARLSGGDVVGPAGDSVSEHRINTIRNSPDAISRLLSTLLQVSELTKDSVLVKNHDKAEFTLILTRDELILRDEAFSWDQCGECVLKKSTVILPISTKLSPDSTFWSFVPVVKRTASKPEGIVLVVFNLPDALSAFRLHHQIKVIRSHFGTSPLGQQPSRPGMLNRLNRWALNSFSCISRRSKEADDEIHLRPHSPVDKHAEESTHETENSLPAPGCCEDSEDMNTRNKHADTRPIVAPIPASRTSAIPQYYMGIKPTLSQPISYSTTLESRPASSDGVTTNMEPLSAKERDTIMFGAMKSMIKMGSLSDTDHQNEDSEDHQSPILSTFVSALTSKPSIDSEHRDTSFRPTSIPSPAGKAPTAPPIGAESHSPQFNIPEVCTVPQAEHTTSFPTGQVDFSSTTPTKPVNGTPTVSSPFNTPTTMSPGIDPVSYANTTNVLQQSFNGTTIESHKIKEEPVSSDATSSASHTNGPQLRTSVSDTSEVVPHALGLAAAGSASEPTAPITNHITTLDQHGTLIEQPAPSLVQSPVSEAPPRESYPSNTGQMPDSTNISNSVKSPNGSTVEASISKTASNPDSIPAAILPAPWKAPTLPVRNSTLSGTPTYPATTNQIEPSSTVTPLPTISPPASSISSANASPAYSESFFAPTPYHPQSGIRPPSIKPAMSGPSPEPPRRSSTSRLPTPGTIGFRPETNGADLSSQPATTPLFHKDPDPVKSNRHSTNSSIPPPDTRLANSGIRPPSVSVRCKLTPSEQQLHEPSLIRPPSTTHSITGQGIRSSLTAENGNGHSAASGLRQPAFISSGIPTMGMNTGIRPPSQVPKPR